MTVQPKKGVVSGKCPAKTGVHLRTKIVVRLEEDEERGCNNEDLPSFCSFALESRPSIE